MSTRIVARFRSSSTSVSTAFTSTTSGGTSVSGSTSSASRSSPSSTKASASILASQIEADLRRHRDPRRAVAEKAYLKSDLEFIGATLPAMRQMVRAITREHPSLDRGQLLKVVAALWRRQVFETRMTAVLLLEEFQALLRPADIGVLERLIRESKTWAFVDGLAIVIVGPLLQRSPQLAQSLDRWARDGDFWLRRAALLALLRPLRRGRATFRDLCGRPGSDDPTSSTAGCCRAAPSLR